MPVQIEAMMTMTINKMDDKPKKEYLKPGQAVEILTLGTLVTKFVMPEELVNDINSAYETSKDLPAHNQELAGKIKDEFKVTDILNDDIKNAFLMCFRQYLNIIQKPRWHCLLENAWINDMRANEYNPFHYHTSPLTDLGLSSVLVLKRPSTYGVEYSGEEHPSNGRLEFSGGQQDPLSIPQLSVDAQVGEIYIFPYTLLHGVYPFNGTDEIRRTLSYNCNLFKDAVVKQQMDKNAKK